MSFLDNIQKFANSPQGMAMASALLRNSGYSRRPVTLGEALGEGLLDIQKVDQQEFNNKYKNSLLDLNKEGLGIKREGLENQKLSTQAYIDNMRQNQARAYQQLKMMMDEQNRQRQAMGNIQNLIGNPETFAEAPVPLRNAGEMVPQGTGSGLLGGQLSQDDFRKQAAKNLLDTGDYQSALSLLAPPKGVGGKPMEVLIDGQPALAQFGPNGEVVPIQGARPMPKKGTSLTVDPKTGEINFSQGGSGSSLGTATINNLQKEQTKAFTLLQGLANAEKKFDPTFLKYHGKVGANILAKINKTPDAIYQLPEDQRKYVSDFMQFKHEMEQTFHLYMQQRFGSRVAASLYPTIRETFPNMDLSPDQFKGSMKNLKENLARLIENTDKTLTEGRINPKKAWELANGEATEMSNIDQAFKEMGYDPNAIAKKAKVSLKEDASSDNDPRGWR